MPLRWPTCSGGFRSRQLPMDVSVEGEDTLVVGGKRVPADNPTRPSCPGANWASTLMDARGALPRRTARASIWPPAQRVLISAPRGDADRTIVYGSTTMADRRRYVVSNASCTTNVWRRSFTCCTAIWIERGYMTTRHAYTGDQRIVDTSHSTAPGAPPGCR